MNEYRFLVESAGIGSYLPDEVVEAMRDAWIKHINAAPCVLLG